MLGLPETYWPFFEFKGSSEEVYDILIECKIHYQHHYQLLKL